MTEQEHREFMESRGFAVARRSTPGWTFPEVWTVYEQDPIDPARPWHPPLWRGLIHLPTGRFQQLGEPWQEWDQGPWHEQVEPESIACARTQTKLVPYGTNSAGPEEQPAKETPPSFLQLCLDAGFEIQSEFTPQAGLYWVRYQGRLEVCYVQSGVVSYRDQRLRATDLQQLIATRSTSIAPKAPPPAPRRSEWNPTAPTQGASKQGSLF